MGLSDLHTVLKDGIHFNISIAIYDLISDNVYFFDFTASDYPFAIFKLFVHIH